MPINDQVTPYEGGSRLVSGTIAALNATLEIDVDALASNVGVQINGTWVGTISFQGTMVPSPVSTDWFPVNAYIIAAGNQTSTTANGQWRISCSCFTKIRVIFTAYTSGTANIYMNTSAATGIVAAHSKSVNDNLVLASQGGIPWYFNTGLQRNVVLNRNFAVTTNTVNIGTSETDLFLFRNPTGSGKSIFIHKLRLYGPGTFRLYFNPTITANGTSLTPLNDAVTTGAQGNVGLATFSPTISARGSLSRKWTFSAQNGTVEIEFPGYLYLAPNTAILLTAIMGANNTPTDSRVEWTEE